MSVKALIKKGITGKAACGLDGSAVLADMLPVIISVILTGFLILAYSSWVSNFETKEQINSIVREYLLRMETCGYLSSADRQMLIDELEDQNMHNISLSGTTVGQVESGGKIVLKIKGELQLYEMKTFNIFSDDAGRIVQTNKEIEITRSTTAVY